ncbi:MAG: D-aminoacyl-tRNA deacylase [Terrisporobacter sp.]|uniref:D-aminoacyl-tRNA deacylase n=1 Tax=Terrisporobacter sp. TaxID=1965305 RepID=UPI002FCA304E
MNYNKKSVYFFCTDYERDEVAPRVLDYLKENYPLELINKKFDERNIYQYVDENNNLFTYVETDVVLSYDYDKYIPLLNEFFSDYDIAGVINWHGGEKAPDKILTVHSTGDVVGGIFAPSSPLYLRNILVSMEKNRVSNNLDDFNVMTEGTHWTGTIRGGNINLIDKYNVPLFDIEIGSTLDSWKNEKAIQILATSLQDVFSDDSDIKVLLCTGGMHFEETFSNIIINKDYKISVGHVLPNQWLVQGEYDTDEKYDYLKKCVSSIDRKIDGIVIHDNLKSGYKNQIKKLAEELNVPTFKHKKLRNPKDLPIW